MTSDLKLIMNRFGVNTYSKLLFNVCYYTKTIVVWADGDGFGHYFRRWHPITWLVFIGALIPMAFLPHSIKEAFPLEMNDYWKDQTRLGKTNFV